ncbi:MAG: hypothetical protein RIT28_2448 [Pseudomonadota bacterium]|jgi:hypothetical protein
MNKLQTLIARLNAGLAPLTARVDAVLESMSARDRKLAAGLFVFVLLLVVGGGAFLLKRDMDSREKRLAAARSDLTFARDEEATHRALTEQLSAIEAQMRESQGQNFSAFVDKAANEAQIRENIQGIREIGADETDGLETKTHTVEVQRITQQQLGDFLYALEGGGYPLQIRNTAIKVVVASGEKRLNVKLEVATYRLIESEAPAEVTPDGAAAAPAAEEG